MVGFSIDMNRGIRRSVDESNRTKKTNDFKMMDLTKKLEAPGQKVAMLT
jgi:hypothetical protein